MRPARYDDPILVQTWVEEVSSGKVVFGYEVSHRETKERLVTGRSTHLWVNNEMKRVNIKRAFPEVYELLVKICAKEICAKERG
jgi:acyl-CoA thioester hydrolase